MQREDARMARYGRPASVLIIEIARPSDPDDGTASATADATAEATAAIRREARETDRVARFGASRFHVLLPETDERDAAVLAERIARACRATLPDGMDGERAIRVAVASPAGGGTLDEALRLAEARLDA
jgi:GGDEF domain-containing protein